MNNLTKSKLLAYRQCPRRLWLEVHRPALQHNDSGTQVNFDTGNQVVEIARRIYDPINEGILINANLEGIEAACACTLELLTGSHPIFEASFTANGVTVFADMMLPVQQENQCDWRMVEIRSSTSVKNHHIDDAAIQTYVAQQAGVVFDAIGIAHIDGTWVYPGGDDYEGLLVEKDITVQVMKRQSDVIEWISSAANVVLLESEPVLPTGRQCNDPFPCSFLKHCRSSEAQTEYPIEWLPRIQKKDLKDFIAKERVRDLQEVPDALLNDRQYRVKHYTLSGQTYFDEAGAASNLAMHGLPAFFLDFETVNFAVPIWKGTRPFQQIPFQFSLHSRSDSGNWTHSHFLDISGADPSKKFAEELVQKCSINGPIFVYNAGFEGARITELSDRFPHLRADLLVIKDLLVDLYPIAMEHYYHPDQHGSWSIKNILPNIAPDLTYGDLVGVQNGTMAMSAFREAIATETTTLRKEKIKNQLLEYCKLDTYAMVRLWGFFSGGIESLPSISQIISNPL